VFTYVFLTALTTSVLLRVALAYRQIRHVAQHRGAVPAVFSDSISLSAHQKAADYTIAKSRFAMLSIALETVVVLGFTLLGGLQWLNQGVRDTEIGQPLLAGLILMGAVGLIGALLDLPLAFYRQFVIEARFGFNRMTPRLFILDWLKQLALGATLGSALVGGVLWLMQAAGAYWWIGAWILWSVFNLLLIVLYPTVIAPLFNRFTPIESGAMRERIEGLLIRCGFSAKGLFVMDGSKRSSHGNAYFTGIGKAKRIVFFDTLLERLTGPQVEAVLAHELGHFKKHHVKKSLVLGLLISLVLLWTLHLLAGNTWFYTGLGVTPSLHSPNDALALVLFFLTLPYFTFFLNPLSALLSRRHEFEADRYAAEQTDHRDLVAALVKLYEDNAATLTPDPWHSAYYDSHPPASIRIDRLMAHGAWLRPGSGAA
jgi:STE24 endopeptidase